jgi:hypothetical protein
MLKGKFINRCVGDNVIGGLTNSDLIQLMKTKEEGLSSGETKETIRKNMLNQMKEQPKYPPQSYTQKLLDAGIIEFSGNDTDDENDAYHWIVYRTLPDFVILYIDNYYMDSPCLIGNIAERYYCGDNADSKYEFENFEVYPYEDIETDDVDNPEKNIVVYKKFEV